MRQTKAKLALLAETVALAHYFAFAGAEKCGISIAGQGLAWAIVLKIIRKNPCCGLLGQGVSPVSGGQHLRYWQRNSKNASLPVGKDRR
ncbi:hypothetical protein HOY34_09280 [Xinfangfangia sp. D13-10-4-6]|uniref:hypothetical protein n=1 Tax=Pseudogemmobacter hezensis TaxID=2737662 RepID=UPI0015582BEC|nr:hypothetical protein [Pseudogemmobacter hezensis]NPD15390.1 hypothetical protein [Pseudogemmobacter hezensis]